MFVAVLLAAGCVPEDRPPDPKRNEPARASAESLPRQFPTALRPATALPARPPAPPPAVPSSSAASAAPVIDDPSRDPVLTKEFKDGFDRLLLGSDWATTGPEWFVQNGRLCVQGAHNHPAWLRKRLPVNARIEFDATSTSPEGDLKAEFWGDGHSAAQTISYNSATSYLTIFGGWKNQFHVLARVDEHAHDRPEVRIDESSDDLRARPVQPNRAYHFKIVRDDGKTVRWYVDDLEILSYPDPQPLKGPGHDHFGFNDWEVRACFDNLVVVPMP